MTGEVQQQNGGPHEIPSANCIRMGWLNNCQLTFEDFVGIPHSRLIVHVDL